MKFLSVSESFSAGTLDLKNYFYDSLYKIDAHQFVSNLSNYFQGMFILVVHNSLSDASQCILFCTSLPD